MTTGSRLAVLRSPAFVACVLVLALNDHYLKGSGLLPGWFTGKLSDFAGLVVAPVLVVVLLGLSRKRARLACFALVAAVFAAIKLWPSAARGLERLTGSVGLDWRIWSDPTDLVAFVVLPLAWRLLAAHESRRPVVYGRPGWVVERLMAMVAMLACLATSSSYVELRSSLVVVNTTHHPIELQIFRPTEPLDCVAVAGDPQASILAEALSLDSCVTLEALDLAPLDLDWSRDRDGSEEHEPPPGSDRVCDAVLLRSPGLEDTLLFWNDVPKATFDQEGGVPPDDAQVVYLERIGDRLLAERPAVAQHWAADFSLPEVSCSEVSP